MSKFNPFVLSFVEALKRDFSHSLTKRGTWNNLNHYTRRLRKKE